MAESYDVIVVGGGHNGLACAAYLARAGRTVLVLERRYVLGGAAVTEELYPGFKYTVCSYVVSLLRPEVIRELELAKHGLQIHPLDHTDGPHGQRRGSGERRRLSVEPEGELRHRHQPDRRRRDHPADPVLSTPGGIAATLHDPINSETGGKRWISA